MVAGVAVGLLAVAAVNLQTFAPNLGWFGDQGGAAADPLLPPPDLEDVVAEARTDRAVRGVATAGGESWTTLPRDPFAAPGAPRAAPPPAVRTRRTRPPQAPLVCAAVLLGGERPLALFDGQTRAVGDHVRGLEITHIDAAGVRLRATDGTVRELAVGPATAADSTYHLVTQTRSPGAVGQTSLAASRSTERTER